MYRPPFEVMPYSDNALCAIAAWVTDTPFQHLITKQQIKYIDNFLRYWSKNSNYENKNSDIRMVVEGNYIDRHYVDEFSQYHVKCFHKYPRDCARIHFFLNEKLTHSAFRDILSSQDSPDDKAKKLGKYLGYIVIRPLPETFIAKICFLPYEQDDPTNVRITIKKTYSASLLGIPLKIKSVAFQEQDHVLAACATSSLWTFFHGHKCISLKNVPSAVAITKSAFPSIPDAESPFPSNGLTIDMICRSIRQQELDAKLYSIKNDIDPSFSYDLFLEQIHAYISADLPIILGVDIEGKGFHAVTILGYGYDDKADNQQQKSSRRRIKKFIRRTCVGIFKRVIGNRNKSKPARFDPSDDAILPFKIKSTAHKITKLYIHDDRTGPYARLQLMDGKWMLNLDRESKDAGEEYRPCNLIFGVHQKIRIHYKRIAKTCSYLMDRIIEVYDTYSQILGEDAKEIAIGVVDNLQWDIKLTESSKFKEELQSKALFDNNEKLRILGKNLPKYVWVATAILDGKDFFQLVFDSTDLPQGDVFMELICFSDESESFFLVFKRLLKESALLSQGNLSDPLSGLIRKLTADPSKDLELSKLFGDSKFPMYIKKEEVQKNALVIQGKRISSIDHKFVLEKDINAQGFDYIWVIDHIGDLVIGCDTIDPEATKHGHPTLLNGRIGRIGGELKFSIDGDEWVINAFSGRYSSNYYTDEETFALLENVCKERFELYFPNDKFRIAEPKSTPIT